MLHTAKQMNTSGFWASLRSRFLGSDSEEARIFSEIDYYRLQGLLTRQRQATFASFAEQLGQLRRMLNRGLLYPCKAIPSNLVTMNSEVLLRSRRGTAFRVFLVYPRDADRKARKVSVLSRLGLGLIGKVEGDLVSSHMVIERILYQPESCGKYYV
jgi:regulator of nucleoside diphosphate kinase